MHFKIPPNPNGGDTKPYDTEYDSDMEIVHNYTNDASFILPKWLVNTAIKLNPKLTEEKIKLIIEKLGQKYVFNKSLKKLIERWGKPQSKLTKDDDILADRNIESNITGVALQAIKTAKDQPAGEATKLEIINEIKNIGLLKLIMIEILGEEELANTIYEVADILSQEKSKEKFSTIPIDMGDARSLLLKRIREKGSIYAKDKISDLLEKLSIYILVNYRANMEVNRGSGVSVQYSDTSLVSPEYRISFLEYSLCKRLYRILCEILKIIEESEQK